MDNLVMCQYANMPMCQFDNNALFATSVDRGPWTFFIIVPMCQFDNNALFATSVDRGPWTVDFYCANVPNSITMH